MRMCFGLFLLLLSGCKHPGVVECLIDGRSFVFEISDVENYSIKDGKAIIYLDSKIPTTLTIDKPNLCHFIPKSDDPR